MSRETAIIFDDGTIESKVLQFELKTSYDIQTVPVEKYSDLQIWIEKAIEYTEGAFKGILKIILHFPFEDYVTKDIRTEKMELERKNPNLRIILWYEQAPRENIKHRAENYGIVEWKLEKPAPVFKPVIDPDTQMKEEIQHIASDIIKENKEKADQPTYSAPSKKTRKRRWNI